MTRDEIMHIIKEKNVNFFRLQFVDIFGFLKNIALPLSQIEKALDGKIMFDGSSIEGFVRINESDMYLKPDYDTFVVMPWREKDGSNAARIICDVYKPDGTPFIGCPRNNLKRVLAEAKKLGYTMNVGTEAEFFLFRRDAEGRATTITDDVTGYFDVEPDDSGIDCRRKIIKTLEAMGFEIEASHHEVAEGQHEINFKYADALTAADNTVTFKWVVRSIAAEFGINGSGMHTNQSLFNLDGTNAFYDEKGPLELSPVAYKYIAGIMKNAKGFCAVTNPLVNSYKRLVAGYEAPVYVAWSASNRSALIRIPASRGMGTRTEVRCPDPACNPYLAFALMLNAGLDGIKNDLPLPPEADEDVTTFGPRELRALGIKSLPRGLDSAIDVMESSELVAETLGEQVFDYFLRNKRAEWETYRSHVTPYELRAYLSL